MRVLLVARDAAPSQGLAKIQKELESEGCHKVIAFLGNGKPLEVSLDQLLYASRSADVILSGCSSTPDFAKEEIAACEEAARCFVPFGFYGDGPFNHLRPWFRDLMKKAGFIFVVDEIDKEDARNLFPKAKAVNSGYLMMEDYFSPRAPAEETRRKLEIDQDEKMILCCGHKFASINFPLFDAVVTAVSELSGLKTVISLHPGDLGGDHSKAKEIYGDFVSVSDIPVKLIDKLDGLRTSDLIPAADVVISSFSLTDIEAACQRKPVIDYVTEVSLDRWEKMFYTRNSRSAQLGASVIVHGNAHELAE